MNIFNNTVLIIKHFIVASLTIVVNLFSPAKNIPTNNISAGIKPTITAIVKFTPTQIPASTSTPTPKIKAISKGLTIKLVILNGGSVYCAPEVIPTIRADLAAYNPSPFPPCSQGENELESQICKINQQIHSGDKTVDREKIYLKYCSRDTQITQSQYIELCFTPSIKDRPIINFNEEVSFSGDCTQSPPDDPITRYYWQFKDGDSKNYMTSVTVEGKNVTHKFTKFSKTIWNGNWLKSFDRGFEVYFCIETKTGKGNKCTMSAYHPSGSDQVVVNLGNCMKNSDGQKNIDQCISELNL